MTARRTPAPQPAPAHRWIVGRPGAAAHALDNSRPGRTPVCGQPVGFGDLRAATRDDQACPICTARVCDAAKTPRTANPTPTEEPAMTAKTTTPAPRKPRAAKVAPAAKAPAKAKPAPAPTAKPTAPRPCSCGCGQPTVRPEALFVAGHDARMAGEVGRRMIGLVADGDDAAAAALALTLPTAALQAKAERMVATAARKAAERAARAAAVQVARAAYAAAKA